MRRTGPPGSTGGVSDDDLSLDGEPTVEVSDAESQAIAELARATDNKVVNIAGTIAVAVLLVVIALIILAAGLWVIVKIVGAAFS